MRMIQILSNINGQREIKTNNNILIHSKDFRQERIQANV